MAKNWKFQGGGGGLREIPTVVGVWIYSGTTHLHSVYTPTNLNAVYGIRDKNVIKNEIFICVNVDTFTCGMSFLSICYLSVYH